MVVKSQYMVVLYFAVDNAYLYMKISNLFTIIGAYAFKQCRCIRKEILNERYYLGDRYSAGYS